MTIPEVVFSIFGVWFALVIQEQRKFPTVLVKCGPLVLSEHKIKTVGALALHFSFV